MGVFSKLFGKNNQCMRCGAKFSSHENDMKDAAGASRLFGVAGIVSAAGSIMTREGWECPTCGGKLCLGCLPMGGSPTCPKCKK